MRQSWLHWKQGIRLLFLDSNEAGGRWSSLKVINLLKSDTTCITSPSTTDLSSYLNPLTNNISLWKGIEKPIQSLLPKQQPFHSFIDDEYWIRARLLRRPIEGNFSTWAYLLTQLRLISRKIFSKWQKKKIINLLTEDVVCFALVITEAVISLEADLPLNSGNWEDEDLVERPLKFAAAHNPPLPEVVELREPIKKEAILRN